MMNISLSNNSQQINFGTAFTPGAQAQINKIAQNTENPYELKDLFDKVQDLGEDGKPGELGFNKKDSCESGSWVVRDTDYQGPLSREELPTPANQFPKLTVIWTGLEKVQSRCEAEELRIESELLRTQETEKLRRQIAKLMEKHSNN